VLGVANAVLGALLLLCTYLWALTQVVAGSTRAVHDAGADVRRESAGFRWLGGPTIIESEIATPWGK
jgi:hypothetical protein